MFAATVVCFVEKSASDMSLKKCHVILQLQGVL